ncbi:hypothetical protein EUGRSUZ_A00806 [Eucalyptus grandis]|uniref:Uncharacterized protein n=2 Tax=Eucalyptus grandis TaxID=71139 RepID=A0ACC3M0J0_EUCGR|nr:hypothetical protein EUGRSUZ_A00806 [Eucalyptus grandis]
MAGISDHAFLILVAAFNCCSPPKITIYHKFTIFGDGTIKILKPSNTCIWISLSLQERLSMSVSVGPQCIVIGTKHGFTSF